MKKIMIICGTGVATSTIAVSRVKVWLEEKKLDKQVQIFQSRILDQIDKLDQYDAVISTAVISNENSDKIISGLPILTGEGLEAFYQQLEAALRED